MKKVLLIGLIAVSSIYPLEPEQVVRQHKYAQLIKDIGRRSAYYGLERLENSRRGMNKPDQSSREKARLAFYAYVEGSIRGTGSALAHAANIHAGIGSFIADTIVSTIKNPSLLKDIRYYMKNPSEIARYGAKGLIDHIKVEQRLQNIESNLQLLDEKNIPVLNKDILVQQAISGAALGLGIQSIKNIAKEKDMKSKLLQAAARNAVGSVQKSIMIRGGFLIGKNLGSSSAGAFMGAIAGDTLISYMKNKDKSSYKGFTHTFISDLFWHGIMGGINHMLSDEGPPIKDTSTKPHVKMHI